MSRWTPIDPEFLIALRVLDAVDVPYAEMWRRLTPVAARIGRPRPSYWKVRRVLIEERRAKLERVEVVNEVLDDILRGVFPRTLK